jgi:cytochrome c7-like protein/class III cytochrome C family protein
MSPAHFIRTLGLILVALAVCSFGPVSNSSYAVMVRATESRQRVQRPQTRPARPSGAREPKVDYTRFSHQLHIVQQKLKCDSCHKFPSKNWKEVRTGNEAFPDVTEYPEHQSCLNCHRQQFFARERPVPKICYNCHFNATPAETSRYPFPSLGQKFLSSAKAADFVSDFQVYFPHDKHLDVISKISPWSDQSGLFVRASFDPRSLRSEDSDPKSCAVCHQTYQPQGKSDDEFVIKPPKEIGDSFWLKKGTFKSRPITHADCFTCHNQESELAPLPQNCDACHKLPDKVKPKADFDPQLAVKIGSDDWWIRTAWRNRFSSGTFRHEVHVEQACTKCHNVNAMSTLDPETLKVGVNSCGGAEGCHVTATSDDGGILNYEMDQRKSNSQFTCVKCHIVFGTNPVPKSHAEAVAKAGRK